MNKRFKSYVSKTSALAALAGSAAAAHAEVPAAVTSELAAMKTDGIVVASAVLVAIIAIAAIKFIRKGL